MTNQIRRAIGFLLYHQGKVNGRRCDVCEHMAKQGKSQVCYACQASDGVPYWKENKTLLQADWDSREYNWPWEDALSPEVVGLLDKLDKDLKVYNKKLKEVRNDP